MLMENRLERFQMSGMEPDEIERILLASSAIPVIFPMETIDKTKYYDGGFFLEVTMSLYSRFMMKATGNLW